MEDVKNVLEETKVGLRLSVSGIFVCYLYGVSVSEDSTSYYINDRAGNQITNMSKLFTKYISFEQAVNEANE